MKGRKKTTPHDADPMKLAWTRGSVASLKRRDEVRTPGHVFTLTESEIEHKAFQLRYHTCNDAYYRLGSDAAAIEGWENGIYAAVNIKRHADDELAYLTRAAGYSQASISWKVDLTGTGLVVDCIQALTLSRTLRGGIVTYDIVSADADQDGDQSGYMTNGWQTLYLIAYLSGSPTEDSYDQTQLLYQAGPDDQDNFPLDILITLKPRLETLCTCTQDSRQVYQAGIQAVVEVHSPIIEKCTCFFPNNNRDFSENASRQRTPLAEDAIPATHRADSLSIVNKHAISLPGTPIHRRHYGSRASSSGNRSHKLNTKNRALSADQRGHDNAGAESPIRMHALHHATSPDQSELTVLEVDDLETMGSRRGTKTKETSRAWTDRKQRDSETLVAEDHIDSSRWFCKGATCTVL